MNKILSIENLPQTIDRIHLEKKTIVLTGGAFDILHTGHIEFLKECKKTGDVLIIFVESDENIKSKKEENRPINSQKHRCIVLASLKSVDYVIPLKNVTKNEEYDKLIVQINPSVIALTQGDKNIKKREEQAKMVKAKLLIVNKIGEHSTTRLINSI